jgi:hypothetical protein
MPNTAGLLKISALKAILIASETRNLRKDERIERLEKRNHSVGTACLIS